MKWFAVIGWVIIGTFALLAELACEATNQHGTPKRVCGFVCVTAFAMAFCVWRWE